MASSGMLCRVALVRTDVLEELSASFIRVTRIHELGTLAVTYQPQHATSLILVAPTMVETSVVTRATRNNIPKDGILHKSS
jgi:hypothetical protein